MKETSTKGSSFHSDAFESVEDEEEEFNIVEDEEESKGSDKSITVKTMSVNRNDHLFESHSS